MLTYAAVNLGLQLYLAGRAREAEAAFIESLRASQQIRNRRAIAGCFEGLGYVAAASGDARWAARLMGAADALRAVTAPLFPQWNEAHERNVRALDATLGRDLARREWAAGGQIDVDDLVADILAQQG
jgi:hypothetical protein